jgi:hypothetical protein
LGCPGANLFSKAACLGFAQILNKYWSWIPHEHISCLFKSGSETQQWQLGMKFHAVNRMGRMNRRSGKKRGGSAPKPKAPKGNPLPPHREWDTGSIRPPPSRPSLPPPLLPSFRLFSRNDCTYCMLRTLLQYVHGAQFSSEAATPQQSMHTYKVKSAGEQGGPGGGQEEKMPQAID